jgi:signal peptidase II
MYRVIRRARLWSILLIIGCTISCDRIAKEIATTTLQNKPVKSYFYDTLRLQYVENEGAFLGLGKSLDPTSRFWIFTIGNGSLLLLVSFWLWKRESLRFSDALGLSLILAGGAGNVLDRLFLNGRVVDFLNIGVGPIRTGIFNLADVAIMMGAALLVLAAPISRTLIPLRYGSLESNRR